MLRDDVIHQPPDLGRHVLNGCAEMADLIGAAHIDIRIQVSRLDLVHGLLQRFDRGRDPRGDIGVDHREKESDKHHDKRDQKTRLQRIQGDSAHRRRPDDLPSGVSDRLDSHRPLFPLEHLLVDPVAVAGRRLEVFLFQPGIQKLGFRMVDQISVRSHEIDIAAVPERNLIEQLFQTVIADIDQKHALFRGGTLRDLDHAGRRDHPAVLVFAHIKDPLDVGNRKMKVLRLAQCRPEPRFLRRIHTGLQAGSGNCLQKLPASGKQGDILHIVLVIVVEQHHLPVDALVLQIRIFDHVVIQGIGKLHDAAEPHIHRAVHLVDQDLIFLLHRVGHLF